MGKTNNFVSVVMPCLNEEKTVALCVQQAKDSLSKAGLKGEVVVCDNGSTDKSVVLAKKAGARVVFEKRRGYGSAYLAGIKAAKGEIIVIGDSDGTYDFAQTPRLLARLEKGDCDLVLGSRLKGRIKKYSMPVLNRFLGTPTLNFFLRLFYGIKISDSQSGMRAFSKRTFQKLKLRTLGMEFASEMLVRTAQEGLTIAEVPISYSRRISPTKLSRFRDAWRHLRFMLLFAPTYLFLAPGIIFMLIGSVALVRLAFGPIYFFGWGLDFHSMILGSMLSLLGYQIIMLGIYAKVFSWTQGIGGQSRLITGGLRYFRLEKGIALGTLISFIGLAVGLGTFFNWARSGFGPLSAVRPAIFSMTLFILGIQIIFSSFFLSILGIEKKA